MAESQTYLGLLDPTEVARMGRLEVVATRLVEGYLAGIHRSPFKGSSVEFAEHRPYTPGDEIRMIDNKTLIGRTVFPEKVAWLSNTSLQGALKGFLEPHRNDFSIYYLLTRA